jgi:sulfofructose kinase
MHAEPSFDVISVGGVCWDILGTVAHYPALDEKTQLEAFLQQGGGLAATAIVAVARLGGRASLWGKIADDEFGHKNLDEFAREGVDTTHLQVVPGGTSQFAFCVAEEGSGHRTIFWKGATVGRLQPEDLDREALLDCRALMVDGNHFEAALQVATWAHEAGVPTVLDMENPNAGNVELLHLCDWPILPEDFAVKHTGVDDALAAGEKLHRELRKPLILTRGLRGSVAFVEGAAHFQPAFVMEKVVDTTGAGDVFHGAFAYGLALGYELAQNLRFAAAVAALKCRALGGRTGIPSFAQAQEFMAQGQYHPLS